MGLEPYIFYSYAAGSNKIGRTCPSIMKVFYTESDVSVHFMRTLLGHVTETGRLMLSKEERNQIAGLYVVHCDKKLKIGKSQTGRNFRR